MYINSPGADPKEVIENPREKYLCYNFLNQAPCAISFEMRLHLVNVFKTIIRIGLM